MTPAAWFRHARWEAADRADFEAGLATAHTVFDRAEFALIQGWVLLERADAAKSALQGALELARRVRHVDRSDIHAARACWLEGCALARLGRSDEALEAFRAAFEAQRDFGGVLTHAHLDFATLVVDHGRRDLFDEALAVLDEFGGDDVTVEGSAFAHHRVRAAIAAVAGPADVARRQAWGALLVHERAGRPQRFPGEPGLFAQVEPAVLEQLRVLAGA